MNLRKMLSSVLAGSMVASMLVVPTMAAEFPDIETHWAKSYIEEMTDVNMFKGYDDGTFRPENQLTAAEALALCARAMGLDEDMAEQIGEDRYDDVYEIMGEDQYWFHQEYAICLEAGILSQNELYTLYTSGDLNQPIEKQNLSIYLIRAMQLGGMAESLSSYSLGFSDTEEIEEEALPYVYLLNIYGIVQGDEMGCFTPELSVTRAVMATMLSRAIFFMDQRGILVELPNYTEYDYIQGTIMAATSSAEVVLLTLSHDLISEEDPTYSDMTSLSVASDILVYEDNMETGVSSLKSGRHVRIALDEEGEATAIYVGDSLTLAAGVVMGINGNQIAMTVDGSGVIFSMDRFTQVRISSTLTGDRTIVDETAGYTNALCKLASDGSLVAVEFGGGTYQQTGIFVSYTTNASGTTNTLRLIDFNGLGMSFEVNDDAGISVNGLDGTLSSGYAGSYVSTRIANEGGMATEVALDSVTKYVQGAVKGTSTVNEKEQISIIDLSNNASTIYYFAETCGIYYNYNEIEFSEIENDCFVTARLSGGVIVRLDVFPGSVVTTGTISARSFGSGDSASIMTLDVTRNDGTVAVFEVDLSNPPSVTRSESTSTVDKVRVGDLIDVTVRYNEVTRLDTTPQTADHTATVVSILKTTTGYTLNLLMSDGEEMSYEVVSGIYVTQSGAEVDISALDAGSSIGIVVSNDQIVSIEILQTATVNNRLYGTAAYISSLTTKYILLRTTNGLGEEEVVYVNVVTSTPIYDANTGAAVKLTSLVEGDQLEVVGIFNGTEFEASIVLRLS